MQGSLVAPTRHQAPPYCVMRGAHRTVTNEMHGHAPSPHQLEHWEPIAVAGHSLAIDPAGAHVERGNCAYDERKALAPVGPVTGESAIASPSCVACRR